MSPRPQRPRPTRAQVLTQLNDLLDLTHWIDQHLDEWQGPSNGGGEGGPGQRGGHSDPTAAAAITPDVETTHLLYDAQAIIRHVVIIEDLILDMRSACVAFRPLTQDQARTSKTADKRPGVGACGACGAWVSGVDPDRLKAGYCPNHYQQWVREDRPDRPEFEARVRADIDRRAS